MEDIELKLLNQSVKYRGIFIERMVALEDITDEIIVAHFAPFDNDKANDLRHAILSKENFNLSFKFSVLSYIIKNYFPDFLKNNKDFGEKYEAMIKKRNEFAHKKFFVRNQEKNEIDKIFYEHYTTKDGFKKIKKIEVNDVSFYKDFDIISSLHKSLLGIFDETIQKLKAKK